MQGKLLGVVTLVTITVIALMSLEDSGTDSDHSDRDRARTVPSQSAPTPTDASPSPSSPPDPPDADTVAQRRTDAAVAAARAFARPDSSTSRQQWWHSLRPTLADDFAHEVRYTDPQQVGYTHLEGDPSVVSTDDDVPARVRTVVKIDTDGGAYGVDVADGEDGPKVTAIYAWADR